MEKLDAGLRPEDHYKLKLPSWRYLPRQWLIPLIRAETPFLALLQRWRTPVLDSYFAVTANLGTHTCFMVVLPILFWCGYTGLGRGVIHILASGVFSSGFLKDLLCLPRPLSPPLKRITMSGSAALEYGFPSTHSTNAVSVAVYAVFSLHSPACTLSRTAIVALESLALFYATSIIIGRLYCGMHGFLDVVVGSVLGALLSVIECLFIEDFDDFIHVGSIKAVSIVVLIICVLVRIHPEPVDDCPCFDDSVAFAGVVCGAEIGNWHFAQHSLSWDSPVRATVPYSLEHLGWTKTILRIVLGISCILLWRGISKSALLKCLPPVYRVIERLGLNLPRRFFKQASEYDRVPKHLKTDNVMPSVSQLPRLISSIRHPQRSRSISIGPQSAADAYEALAFRQQRRRESLSAITPSVAAASGSSHGGRRSLDLHSTGRSRVSWDIGGVEHASNGPTSQIRTQTVEAPILEGSAIYSPVSLDERLSIKNVARTPSQDRRDNEKDQREIFSQLKKTRIRYDVEVVTKLIVYSGIAWIAVEGSPILFQYVGLGVEGDLR